jgi:Putative beta-barrel porin-2, OmpL-like. bbp2
LERMISMLGLKIGFMIFCGMVALAAPVIAEDAKPAAPAVSADDIKKALGISFYVQGGYTYNGSASNGATQDSVNDLRVFDHDANSFTLDLAQILISKDTPTPGNVGYRIKISTGETAKWIHARGLSGAPLNQPQSGEGTDTIDVTEAYVSYMSPIGSGLRFDLGKMVTYFGAEVIEAIDNPNYSRSFLFNYAIPFTHTGLKMSYGITDALSASLYVVNGWDNAEDNNSGKSIGVSIGYAPSDIFSGYVNYMSGPEHDSIDHNIRTLVDFVATIKPVKPLSFILNYDDGVEHNYSPAGNATWFGFAGIVKYDFNDTYSLSVRGETFNDPEGIRTGMQQNLNEWTVTPEIRIAGGLIVRPEYRHDMSDKQSFDNGAKKSQDTIALGTMYRW